MGAQFIMFSAIDLGIGILLERQRGLWKRLRSAPLSRFWLLAGKALSIAIIGFVTMLVAFAFAIVVFKVRIAGSVGGFVAIAAAYAVMVATFGLLVAALGETPGGLLSLRLVIPHHHERGVRAPVGARAQPDVIGGVVLTGVSIGQPAPARAQRRHRAQRCGQAAFTGT